MKTRLLIVGAAAAIFVAWAMLAILGRLDIGVVAVTDILRMFGVAFHGR